MCVCVFFTAGGGTNIMTRYNGHKHTPALARAPTGTSYCFKNAMSRVFVCVCLAVGLVNNIKTGLAGARARMHAHFGYVFALNTLFRFTHGVCFMCALERL